MSTETPLLTKTARAPVSDQAVSAVIQSDVLLAKVVTNGMVIPPSFATVAPIGTPTEFALNATVGVTEHANAITNNYTVGLDGMRSTTVDQRDVAYDSNGNSGANLPRVVAKRKRVETRAAGGWPGGNGAGCENEEQRHRDEGGEEDQMAARARFERAIARRVYKTAVVVVDEDYGDDRQCQPEDGEGGPGHGGGCGREAAAGGERDSARTMAVRMTMAAEQQCAAVMAERRTAAAAAIVARGIRTRVGRLPVAEGGGGGGGGLDLPNGGHGGIGEHGRRGEGAGEEPGFAVSGSGGGGSGGHGYGNDQDHGRDAAAGNYQHGVTGRTAHLGSGCQIVSSTRSDDLKHSSTSNGKGRDRTGGTIGINGGGGGRVRGRTIRTYVGSQSRGVSPGAGTTTTSATANPREVSVHREAYSSSRSPTRGRSLRGSTATGQSHHHRNNHVTPATNGHQVPLWYDMGGKDRVDDNASGGVTPGKVGGGGGLTGSPPKKRPYTQRWVGVGVVNWKNSNGGDGGGGGGGGIAAAGGAGTRSGSCGSRTAALESTGLASTETVVSTRVMPVRTSASVRASPAAEPVLDTASSAAPFTLNVVGSLPPFAPPPLPPAAAATPTDMSTETATVMATSAAGVPNGNGNYSFASWSSLGRSPTPADVPEARPCATPSPSPAHVDATPGGPVATAATAAANVRRTPHAFTVVRVRENGKHGNHDPPGLGNLGNQAGADLEQGPAAATGGGGDGGIVEARCSSAIGREAGMAASTATRGDIMPGSSLCAGGMTMSANGSASHPPSHSLPHAPPPPPKDSTSSSATGHGFVTAVRSAADTGLKVVLRRG